MSVEIEQIGPGIDAVAVTGNADFNSSAELKEQLLGLVDRQAGDVVLDLGGCNFLDSTIVAVIVSTVHELAKSGRRLLVVAPGAGAARVMSLTGVDRAVTLVDSRAAALAALQGP